MVFPVFYEASGTSARNHPCGIDHVEACRPQGLWFPSSVASPRNRPRDAEDVHACAGDRVDPVGASRHPELGADAQRALVARVDDRDHLARLEVLPAPAQRRAGRLSGETSSPRRARQAPAHLDGGQHGRQERGNREAAEAQQHARRRLLLDRPQPEAPFIPLPLEPPEKRVASRTCERPTTADEPHDLWVRVQRGERLGILGTPPAQQQLVGPHLPEYKQRTQDRSALEEPRRRAPRGGVRRRRRGLTPHGLALSRTRSRVCGERIAGPSRPASDAPHTSRNLRRTIVGGMSTMTPEDVAWDLEPLVAGDGPAGVDRMLDDAERRAAAFADRHAGRVAALDGAGLAETMAELEAIAELVGRAGSYASLRFSADTADPANGALLQKVQERGTTVETTLLFFELEWAALDDERVDELLAADGLERVRHHLRTMRRYRPHLLTEPEERIMAEKAVSGRDAWSRLFSEITSAIKVDLPEALEPVALDVALSQLTSPDRDHRRTVAESVTEALKPTLRTRAFVFNTLLADKATDDRLRRYPTWLSSRNLANEASDESVQALVDAVRGAYDIPQRWYRLKARLLGIDRLKDYDRMASVATADESFEWDEAKQIVLDSFGDFSPLLADTARRFFDEHWIDAPPRPSKRGGAFCSYAVPSVHPYVMLNYTARRRDVLTLAHELGHGLHAALARPR